MNSEELKNKAFSGVIWSFINQFGTLLIGIIPSMILARLLSPAEFGLIAMVGIFNGLAFNLSTGGFSDALLQKKNASHLDCCSVYYANLVINTFFYIVFFFLAPFCADFFSEPQITTIMRVSLLSLPLVALGGVHSILLKKELNFKAPAIRNFIVQSVAAVVAVVLAFLGCGVWSLVVQGVLQTFGNSIVNWFLCSWRPSFVFSLNNLKEMFNYGVKIYLSGLVNYGFGKAIDTTIAKIYTPADLSYYNRAFSTANIGINSILGSINNVAFPAFAKMQGDVVRLRNGISRMVSIASLVSFFAMTLSFVLAEPLFNFMYSSKWNAVIPLFQVVCIWGLFQPIRAELESMLRATGCAGIILYNRIVKNILILGLVALAWKFSVLALIWGQIAIEIIQIFIFAHFTSKFYKYGVLNILNDCCICIIPSCIVALLTFIIDCEVVSFLDAFIQSEFLLSNIRLLISASAGIICYILVNRFLKISSYENLVLMFLGHFFKNSSKKIKLQEVLIRK